MKSLVTVIKETMTETNDVEEIAEMQKDLDAIDKAVESLDKDSIKFKDFSKEGFIIEDKEGKQSSIERLNLCIMMMAFPMLPII